jgi:hypothetical protein
MATVSMTRARLSTSFKLSCDFYSLHSTVICICICLSNIPSTHSWLSRHVNPTVPKECYHAHVIFSIHQSTDIHSCANLAAINRAEAIQRLVLMSYCVPSCATAFSIILYNPAPFKPILLVIISKPVLNTVVLSNNIKPLSAIFS